MDPYKYDLKMDEQARLNLIKQSQEGMALSELKSHNGYKELIDIFKSLYVSALEELENADDLEARATIKVVKDIVSIIDDKIKLGDQAREELREETFKNQM